MNDELRAKIAADIEKSGFGSEMKALRAIQEAGWSASSSVHFTDRDTQVTRESDIEAHFVLADSSEDEREINYQAFLGLSIEVKKSERPWIVFKAKGRTGWEGLDPMVFCAGVHPKFRNGIRHSVAGSSLSTHLGWSGNGLHESFKNPDQPSRWYSAFVSACKAAEEALADNSWERDDSKEEVHSPYLWLSVPVIVLDGSLISADLGPQGDLVLSDEDMCSVRFVYNTPQYRRRQYSVDMVTLGALPKYLEIGKARIERLKDGLMKLATLDPPPTKPGRISLGKSMGGGS